MMTLRNVLQFNVFRCSERIHRLKAEAFQSVVEKRGGYFLPDGSRPSTVNPGTEKGLLRWKQYDVERTTSYMSPKHVAWKEYVAAKEEVSRWCTALHLLKLGEGKPPLKKDVRKSVRAGGLQHHVGKAKASAFVFSALALLNQTSEEFAQNPGAFVEAERFCSRARSRGARTGGAPCPRMMRRPARPIACTFSRAKTSLQRRRSFRPPTRWPSSC